MGLGMTLSSTGQGERLCSQGLVVAPRSDDKGQRICDTVTPTHSVTTAKFTSTLIAYCNRRYVRRNKLSYTRALRLLYFVEKYFPKYKPPNLPDYLRKYISDVIYYVRNKLKFLSYKGLLPKNCT